MNLNNAPKRKVKAKIKMWDTGDGINYEAVVRRGDGGMKISGSTYCGTKECIKQIIRHALTCRSDPPEDVEKAVQHIIGYLFTSVKLLGARDTSASLTIGVDVEAELTLKLAVYYLDGGEAEDDEEYVGWYAELRAAFSGYDGVAAVDGFHEFKKELTLGRYLDDAAVKKLTEELKGLAKLAYNVLPAKA